LSGVDSGDRFFEQGQARSISSCSATKRSMDFMVTAPEGVAFVRLSPGAFYSASPVHGLGLRLHLGTVL